MRYEDQRANLVKELTRSGIKDEKVLAAFAKVPREEFVLPQYREYAYRNQPLPIHLQQTISQPLMVAIMMQLLELKETDSVLEIGTGSGYQTALLAEIVKEVCTVERLEPLTLQAKQVLKSQGYQNIFYRIGDGAGGWQKAYPPRQSFDKIIISAAASSIPKSTVKQLAQTGIMVLPVGGSDKQLLTIVKRLNDEIIVEQEGYCAFVPLVSNDKSGGSKDV